MIVRTYSELSRIETFEDRFRYLQLKGRVGKETFGLERMLNQDFYRSWEWKNIRKHVIARDNGNDLGVDGYGIHDKVIIHHINPMTPDDILHGNEDILNPDFLITVSHETHNALHYGTQEITPRTLIERRSGDHILW